VNPSALGGWALIGAAAGTVAYTAAGYPLLLRAIARSRPPLAPAPLGDTPPMVTVVLPAFNEERQIAAAVEALLALDYPRERLQLLVVSDGSTDDTDRIVEGYAQRGVELLRIEERGGKTRAENLAAPHIRGEIVVNTDASIRLHPGAVRALVPWFADPEVGVASGRDVSVGDLETRANVGETGYVNAEMDLRALETRVAGIVGASGSLYAIRKELHLLPVPEGLSRDFSAALTARRHGYRAVSVDEAICYVPRTPSLQREYRRKIRTVTRGMQTLWHNRDLLNPARHGLFAWMLFSHKLCRWLIPWAGVAGAVGLTLLALSGERWASLPLIMAIPVLALTALAWRWPTGRPLPRAVSVPAFAVLSSVAILLATLRAAAGSNQAVWEPTRRDVMPAA
jgi:cellulose synthase/poly-beta-1,6-N-acetylglucosamine synthase-like glycosyltransferase